jgi:hypothetical protein
LLSRFHEQVGDHLKDRYEAATEVKLNKRGKLQVANKRFARPTKLDLVYVDDSPDYCSAEHLRPSARSSAAVSRKWRKSTGGRSVNSKRTNAATRSQRKRSSGSSNAYSNSHSTLDELNEPNTIDVDQKPSIDTLDSNHHKSSGSSSGLSPASGPPNKEFVYEEGTQLEPDADAPTAEAADREPSLLPESPDTDEPVEPVSEHSLSFPSSTNEHDASNRSPAWLGTQGRACNRSSLSTDSCSLMCCGRGYNTQRVVVREKCNCKFNWCCWVQCDTCTYVKTIHTCK